MLHLVGDEGFVLTPGHFQLRLGPCFLLALQRALLTKGLTKTQLT